MLGHTHALIGSATIIGMQVATGFIQLHVIDGIPAGPVFCLTAGVVGALLPDIDAKESTINQELGLAGNLFHLMLNAFGVKHRGLTHTGLTALIVMGLGLLIGSHLGFSDVGLAFGLGYLSHLLADSLTKAGTPFLWPLADKMYLLPKPLRIRTGSPVETLLFMALGAVVLAVSPFALPPEILDMLKKGFL